MRAISLEDVFPDYTNEIRRLKRTSPSFRGISNDFVILCEDLEKAKSDLRSDSKVQSGQIIESLNGLIEEIAFHLGCASPPCLEVWMQSDENRSP